MELVFPINKRATGFETIQIDMKIKPRTCNYETQSLEATWDTGATYTLIPYYMLCLAGYSETISESECRLTLANGGKVSAKAVKISEIVLLDAAKREVKFKSFLVYTIPDEKVIFTSLFGMNMIGRLKSEITPINKETTTTVLKVESRVDNLRLSRELNSVWDKDASVLSVETTKENENISSLGQEEVDILKIIGIRGGLQKTSDDVYAVYPNIDISDSVLEGLKEKGYILQDGDKFLLK